MKRPLYRPAQRTRDLVLRSTVLQVAGICTVLALVGHGVTVAGHHHDPGSGDNGFFCQLQLVLPALPPELPASELPPLGVSGRVDEPPRLAASSVPVEAHLSRGPPA